MNILIANVGNVRSNEIKVLAEALNKKHTVTIACMAVDSSCKGQSFSLCGNPVRVSQFIYKDVIKNTKNVTPKALEAVDGIMAYEFYSTPADAVSIMLGEIMAHTRPDIVICGINNNVHMGQDIYMSSNIGMAMEAGFFNVPSIAVGIERRPGGHTEEECANAVKFIERNIEKIAALKLPTDTFLNINIPTVEKYSDLKGVKIVPLGKLTPLNQFEERTDPVGGKYYWASLVERKSISESNSCICAFEAGYVAVTPISYDATCRKTLSDYEKIGHKQLKVKAGGGA